MIDVLGNDPNAAVSPLFYLMVESKGRGGEISQARLLGTSQDVEVWPITNS